MLWRCLLQEELDLKQHTQLQLSQLLHIAAGSQLLAMFKQQALWPFISAGMHVAAFKVVYSLNNTKAKPMYKGYCIANKLGCQHQDLRQHEPWFDRVSDEHVLVLLCRCSQVLRQAGSPGVATYQAAIPVWWYMLYTATGCQSSFSGWKLTQLLLEGVEGVELLCSLVMHPVRADAAHVSVQAPSHGLPGSLRLVYDISPEGRRWFEFRLLRRDATGALRLDEQPVSSTHV